MAHLDPSNLTWCIVNGPRLSASIWSAATDLLRQAKTSGALVMSRATTVAQASGLDAQCVDAVNAQGPEAGGHRGTFLETDPSSQAGLLPQIASTVRFL
jgi:nitronate monooxygenase